MLHYATKNEKYAGNLSIFPHFFKTKYACARCFIGNGRKIYIFAARVRSSRQLQSGNHYFKINFGIFCRTVFGKWLF